MNEKADTERVARNELIAWFGVTKRGESFAPNDYIRDVEAFERAIRAQSEAAVQELVASAREVVVLESHPDANQEQRDEMHNRVVRFRAALQRFEEAQA